MTSSRHTRILLLLVLTSFVGCNGKQPDGASVFQLNWLHDPTFAGHYLWTNDDGAKVVLRQGGSNISPVAELVGGRADLAVVGADIFLKTVAEDLGKSQPSRLHCISVDFQRNPVGWVMHPDAVKKAGLSDHAALTQQELNAWLFDKLKSGEISIGDKRGTETTAIWMSWSQHHQATDVNVVPVGFDASIVLGAPMLAYPVYLNEEPYKLSSKADASMVVFDPAADGIILYGNVIVCRHADFKESPKRMRAFAASIQNGWNIARDEPDVALDAVLEVYKDVDAEVVSKQIERTVEFVFDGTSEAGKSDLTQGGRWEKTIDALVRSDVLPESMTLKVVKEFIDER